jgi:hypothetical protein
VRRALACLITVVLVLGVAAAVRGDDAGVEHWLPAVLPLGYELQDAQVAGPGATLLAPLDFHQVRYDRGGRFTLASWTDRPDPANVGSDARAFLGGRATVARASTREASLRWSTPSASGSFVSTAFADDGAFVAFAREVVRHGFRAPPGWRAVVAFDRGTAVEVLQYRGDRFAPRYLTIFVHRRRDLLPVPTEGVRQRRLGDVVVTVFGSGPSPAELAAVVRSVAEVPASAWADAMAAAEVDGRPLRWRTLAQGTTSTGVGWAFALADRGDEACPAVLTTRYVDLRDPQCVVAWWRSEPVLAVPTDRAGPVDVVAAGHRLHRLGEVTWRGRRIVIAELPDDLAAGIVDPVEVVSRR